MTTLVTGAGLVGTSFARCAKERGEHVVFLDPVPREDYLRFKLGDKGYSLERADVRSLAELIAVIQRYKVDTIVHTAGVIGSKAQKEIGFAFEVNVIGTRNIAEAARLTGIRRVVHASTMGVYDERRKATEPVKETFWRGSGRAYGNNKVCKELILEAYAGEFGFELLMLRLANVYGVGHFWAGSSGGMKMQALMEAAIAGTKAVIPLNETMDNEYIYARDAGRAIDIAATIAKPKDIVFNIGNGVITPFTQVVAALKEACPALDYVIGEGTPPKSKAQAMDITRAREQLGWSPKFSMADGMRDYREEMQAYRTTAAAA